MAPALTLLWLESACRGIVAHDSLCTAMQELLRAYFTALPKYQGVPLSQLRFRRVLFGGFPSFPAAPLKPAFDRILQVCCFCRTFIASPSEPPAA